jgi:hypothetical protein
MQPIQLNINVNVGVDSAVIRLLSGLVGKAIAGAAMPAPVVKKEKAVEALPAPAVAEKKSEPTPAETTAPTAEREYTEADVRAAMDNVRRRIEGEDYKTSTESDLYVRWHKELTRWFKNAAAVFGADKPSALATSDARRGFIRCCEELTVVNGVLTDPTPY